MKKYIRTAKSPRYNVDRAFSSDPSERAKYARRIKDPTALEVYIYDDSGAVRAAAAANANLPIEYMEVLAHDPDGNVLFNLSHNKSTPAPILAELAESRFYGVRMGVTLNPNTPEDVLRELASDFDAIVCSYAKHALRKRGISI